MGHEKDKQTEDLMMNIANHKLIHISKRVK